MKYRIVYERSPRNYGAWSPDLPGCVSTGKSLEATRRVMREAIAFHLDGMARDGDARPKPTGFVEILGFEPSAPKRRKTKTGRPVRAATRSRK